MNNPLKSQLDLLEHGCPGRSAFGFSGLLRLGQPRSVLILAIRIYKLIISPAQTFLFGPFGGCRFTPTCSQYAMDALRERGAIAGTIMAAKRICRCHPFGGCGHDPVPEMAGEKQKTENQIVILHSLFVI